MSVPVELALCATIGGSAVSIISATSSRVCSSVREKPRSRLKSVREDAVDGVGYRRTCRATGVVARSEHEVVDEQLGSPVEQLDERLLAVVRVDAVFLLHPHPRQLASLLRDLVAEPGVLLFADE